MASESKCADVHADVHGETLHLAPADMLLQEPVEDTLQEEPAEEQAAVQPTVAGMLADLFENQPYIIRPSGVPNTFDFCFAATRVRSQESMVTNFSPDRQPIDTLEYNLRHAVEKRDEARMAACLTELFRHFVSLNIPMTRYASHQLYRDTQLELRMAIGPFANPLSLGMHQRILALLLGIVVRQLGIAAPTMTSYVMKEWKLYERVLFHRPALALARLLSIGVTLCHCKKDASVAYTRHIFEDTSNM